MATFPYDASFDPPAPILPVGASSAHVAEGVTVPAFVDSGADLSAMPATVARKLGLSQVGETAVSGPLGGARLCPLFSVSLWVPGVKAVSVEAVLWQEPYLLLGRDALNEWKVTLDGPQGSLGIE